MEKIQDLSNHLFSYYDALLRPLVAKTIGGGVIDASTGIIGELDYLSVQDDEHLVKKKRFPVVENIEGLKAGIMLSDLHETRITFQPYIIGNTGSVIYLAAFPEEGSITAENARFG